MSDQYGSSKEWFESLIPWHREVKKLAARDICGSSEENYKVLYKYLYMLERVNHGKVTNVEADGGKNSSICFRVG